MHCYINDFSYQENVVHTDTRSLITDFISVCERIQSFSFEKLYLPNDYKIRAIVNNFSIITFIGNTSKTDNIHRRLISLIVNQIKSIANDEIDNAIQYVYWNNSDSEFFRKAYNLDMPVISFRVSDQFNANTFAIESRVLDEDGRISTTNGCIKNICNSVHFTIHHDYLVDKMIQQANNDRNWDALNNPFRFIDRMNQFLIEIDYENKKEGNGNHNFKMGLFFEVGTMLAELNGWEKDRRISRINSTPNRKRTIFYARNPTAYLSIDFYHGTFELHDRHGTHITEYNFNGLNLETTYADKSHNIII